jgi:hypothetical protein
MQQRWRIRAVSVLVMVTGLGTTLEVHPQQPESERFAIQWRDHTFYTNRPLPEMASALTLTAYPETVERGYYFVQFTGLVTSEMRAQATQAGADLLEYVPENAFIARMDAAARERVGELPDVQSVNIFQPAMRLSKRLTRVMTGAEETRVQPTTPRTQLTGPEPTPTEPTPLQLTVMVFRGEDLQAIQQTIERAGGTVLQAVEGPRQSKLLVTIPRENALDIAQINGVRWIEEFTLPSQHNDVSRGVLNVPPVWSTHGLTGAGQIIGVSDTGLDTGN